jgi:subtilisin family serine protease
MSSSLKKIILSAFNISGEISEFSAIIHVDVWAPGEEIYSTFTDGTYETLNGTSMAALHYVLQMIIQD